MGKAFVPLATLAFIVIVGAFILLKVAANSSAPVAAPLPTRSPTASPTASPTSDPYAGWKTFSTRDFAFTFRYPGEWGDVTLTHKNGDTGTIFSGKFSGNDLLSFGGQTADYSVGTGATFLNFSGCTKNTDGSYACQFAAGKTRPTTPAETVITASGSTALILFNTQISQVLAKTTRAAYVNLSGAAYPGVAFQYLSIPAADAGLFDNMIRSIKSL